MVSPRVKESASSPAAPFATSPVFAGLPITHGFFGRQGGISTGFYESLNTGFAVGDIAENARENSAIVMRTLGLDPQKRFGLYQVHGTAVHTVTENSWTADQIPQGDGMVTNVPSLTLSILTADCAPVLFATDNVIGACHAGWGGAVKGVMEATIQAMENLGAQHSQIRVAIGPCIGPESYEVSSGFEKPFLAEDETSTRFFKLGKNADKLMFDLPGYCAWRLARAGLTHVDVTGHDTCALEAAYFSHRRATQRQEPARGLQMSAICLKP